MLTLTSICTFGYIKFLLDERTKVQNHFNSLIIRIENFFVHLSSIYELEMFYGDQTLEDLIKHSKQLMDSFYEFEEQYFEELNEEEKELDDTEETETSQEKEKSIFHEGP